MGRIINKIDIVGMGALGTMYGKFFTDRLGYDNVRILANASRTARYISEKVYYNGQVCDLNWKDISLETEKSDLLIFSVKYGGLAEAMEEAAHLVGNDTIIISVLNGIRSEEDLSARFGADKVVYCTAQRIDTTKEGNRVSCSGIGEWSLGVMNGGRKENLKAVTEILDRTGFRYVIPEDMRVGLWSKLVCNVGVNQTVNLFEGTYATVQVEGEAREMMQQAMRECVAVGQAEGVALSDDLVDYWTEIIDHLDPDGMPSMRQDGKAGRKTEVDLFAGTVCALGRKHGIATPVNDIFLAEIK